MVYPIVSGRAAPHRCRESNPVQELERMGMMGSPGSAADAMPIDTDYCIPSWSVSASQHAPVVLANLATKIKKGTREGALK
jgi:hypothetical protein